MTDQEINHLIATQVNGWIHDEGIFYHDENGNTCYLANYCHSIAHALDLAKANEIALKPTVEGWAAYRLSDEAVVTTDLLASKAICLCLTAVPPTS
jgi:hypothetical protein